MMPRRVMSVALLVSLFSTFLLAQEGDPMTQVATAVPGGARVIKNAEIVFTGLFETWRRDGSLWCERSDTYMYVTCMRVAGWPQDYAEVITVSGYGPSFGYSQETWWAHYFPPPGRDRRIGEATGFGFRWEQHKTPEAYWQALKQAIDAGKPVYGPYMEGVLFIGYREAERADERQVRPLAAVFVEPGSWWTWARFCDWHAKHSDGGWFGCHTGRVKAVPPRDSALAVLRLMVQMASADPRRSNPQFAGVLWGLAGILAYADDLADTSKSGAPQDDGGFFQGGWRGCHNIIPQMSGRPAAAVYLRRVAPLFPAAQKHILAAAAAYDCATDAWREFDRQLGRALVASGHDHTAAWLDPAHRTAGASAVRQAHDHEESAIAAIAQALAAVDASSSPPGVTAAVAAVPATEAKRAGVPASAVLLADVPWVGFYKGPDKGNPEDHPLPSVMRALMEYRGDDLGLPGFAERRGTWRWSACALFHGTTGSGFAFAWKHPYGEGYLGRTWIQAFDKVFATAGYDCRMVLRPAFAAGQDYAGPLSDDPNEFRHQIVQSIRERRLPVIAIGVIGPDEPCLISGFENDGEVLIGWSFFQDDARQDPRVGFDAAGRFVLRDWFRDLRGLVVPGDKADWPAARRDLCVEALRRDLALLCECGPAGDPRAAAAYQAWIAYLLAPLAEGAAADPRQLDPLHAKHNECVGELAERRAYAGTFLSLAAEVLPAVAADLQEACHCHQAMHDLLWRVWQTLGLWHKTDDDKLRRYAQPEFRVELASLVRRLQAWDAESARHLRAALVRLGVAETDLPPLPTPAPVTGLRDMGIEQPLLGRLGRLWETPDPVIPGVAAPVGPGLAAAVRAAAAVTEWPISAPLRGDADLRAWAAAAGWHLRVVEVPPDEPLLARARRINDVILSCLYGQPVATTHAGRPAVVVGYEHLAGETLRVRLPGQSDDDPAAKIRLDDKGWGQTWAFLVGR